MSDRYDLGRATADLEAGGLLRAVVKADGGRWREVEPASAAGSFHGAVIDSRIAAPGVLFVGLPGTRTDGRRFAAAALAAGAVALVGPGPGGEILPDEPASADGVVLVSDDPGAALARLAHCWRARFDLPVIGITGSNGKTTTKDFTQALLASAAGADAVLATRGNLNSAQGVPLTVLGLAPRHRYAVVEMGASAVGHIAARAAVVRPRVGVITNAAAAHLEEFGSLEQVISGKGEMVADLPPDGAAVLNADSPGFDVWRERASCPVVSWGRDRGDHRWSATPGDKRTAGWLVLDGRRWPVPLPGEHNAANLCAAILAARAVGLDDAQLDRGLEHFRGSAHRGDLCRLAGRTMLDDSYNANPASVLSAVQALLDLPGGDAVAVLGFMAELGPDSDALHRRCGRDCAALGLGRLLVVGEAARPLVEGFAEIGGDAELVCDHATAADRLADTTRPGDRILLKGSRSAGMEAVLAALESGYGWRREEES